MDNPGLAFLKQMFDPKVSTLVFGKGSLQYKECLKTKLTIDVETVPIVIFNGKNKQISIERNYIFPKNVKGVYAYLFVYTLIRDKLLPFLKMMFFTDFKNLRTNDQVMFDSNPKSFSDCRKGFKNNLHKNFETQLLKVLKNINFKDSTNDEAEFLKVRDISRRDLVAEFEALFCYSDETDNTERNMHRDVDDWLLNLELVPSSQRLFSLMKTNSIEEGIVNNAEVFGLEIETVKEWIGKGYLVIMMNSQVFVRDFIKFKRCTKILVSIEEQSGLSLTDCLSKCSNKYDYM